MFVDIAAYSIFVQGVLAGGGSHGGDDRHLDGHLDSWTTGRQLDYCWSSLSFMIGVQAVIKTGPNSLG